MKHFVQKSKRDIHKCIEPCPFRNSKELLEIHKKTEGMHFRSLIMVGSGECQGCEHHKNNNIFDKRDIDDMKLSTIEILEKNNKVIKWIECDKLN